MSIEAENAKEEVKEIVDRCVRCGMCKANCPVFKIMKEEVVSPRGKAILLQDDIYDKIIYECTLCKSCELKCPSGIELCEAFKKARKALASSGKDTKANKEMIKNVRKSGNPFGDAKKIDKLYCC